jgi:acetylornithine deacetylase/succinyl-diaminopimelate desuccinylase-like protein
LEKLLFLGGTSGEEQEVLQWIGRFLERCGFEEIYWQEYDPGKWNLYARRGTSPFLLATHVDVHYAGRKRDYAVKDGFVFGAGVLDTRGQIAALLDALQRSSSPAELVFFSEEETTGAGSWHFVPHREFEGAVVLEPTSFSLCTALAGDVEVRFQVEGLSGHGAYPHAAQNALFLAMEVVRECETIVNSLSSHPLFVPPLRLMLGKIEGGESSYVIPECCVVECAIPFPPPYGVEEVRNRVLGLEKRYPVRVTLLDSNQAFSISQDAEVVERLKRALEKVEGKEAVYAGMPSWTDATYLAMRGVPSVVFGAGDLALAHSERECVSVVELERLREVFLSFLA